MNPGSYSVNPTGTCGSYSPSVTNLNNLKANATANFTGTSCTFCPTLDALVGLSESATCNTMSSIFCASDRLSTWAGEIVFDFQNVESDVLAANDCRFGKWQQAPIVNDFTFVGVLEQQTNNLSLFTLQLFGCALAGNLTGVRLKPATDVRHGASGMGIMFTSVSSAVAALLREFISTRRCVPRH